MTEYTTQTDVIFVRVHGLTNMDGDWVMKAEDIEGLTPQQIQSIYSLPAMPKYVSEVHVPAGTRLREGIANPIPEFGGEGNGI